MYSVGAFLASVAIAFSVVRLAQLTGSLAHDLPATGPQKFHSIPTPRLGGLPILGGLMVCLVGMAFEPGVASLPQFLTKLLVSASFAFSVGFAEDVTRRIPVGTRLIFTFVSAALAFFLLDARVSKLGLPALDGLMSLGAISFVFTVFAVGGLSHAINIVDGFNGLAGMLGLLFLAAIAYVSGQVGDETILATSLILAGAIGGFLLFNFPRGLMFLGDGGAYAVGFLIAELGVLLVQRNSSVSPWFPLVLFMYPVWETCFSIYRKRFVRHVSPGQPDGLHLHMLVHKRLVRHLTAGRANTGAFWRNALTSPFMWALALVAVVPATLFWDSTSALEATAATFALLYVAIYRALVRFHTPGRRLIAKRLERLRTVAVQQRLDTEELLGRDHINSPPE